MIAMLCFFIPASMELRILPAQVVYTASGQHDTVEMPMSSLLQRVLSESAKQQIATNLLLPPDRVWTMATALLSGTPRGAR